jgi:release factor glutamine methyltransferase
MIELLKSLIETEQPHFKTDSPLRIADVGTGSGALGITAVLEVPGTVVDLLDIDQKALETAKINVDKLTSGMTVTQSDLLRSADRHYDVLLCNLPYVPDDYQLNLAAGHEPKIAIFGGPDGLDIYRQLFKQVEKLTKQPLFILTEALPPQHAALDSIANQSGYSITQSEDFIQVFRVQKKALWAKNLSYFMMRPA